MFDIGWQELLILMLIALIVVGPKDLPRIVRTAGQWMGKARGYARDFQRTIEEAADATEMDAVKKEIDEANKELANARRDVSEGADGVNKMFSEDVFDARAKADGKSNGEAKPAGEAGDGKDAAAGGDAAAPQAAETKGNDTGDSPGHRASA